MVPMLLFQLSAGTANLAVEPTGMTSVRTITRRTTRTTLARLVRLVTFRTVHNP